MTSPLPSDQAESWPVLDSRDLHRDQWVMALRADLVSRPDAPDEEPFSRLVLEHPGAAVVLAVDDAQRVLCLSQYRHAAQRRFIEVPAGLLDGAADEPPLEVAKRELQEEAGFAAATWEPLTSAYSTPGISEELIHYFFATDLTEVGRGDFTLRHEEAAMETLWVPFEDLYAAALGGLVADAPVVLAVLMARARGLV